jgi:hypothetical protein
MALSPVTQADLDAVAKLKVAVYADGNFLGISDAGEHPMEINFTSEPVGSAFSGENGAYLSHNNGVHCMLRLTVHGLNKNNINVVNDRIFTEDSYFPLSATDAHAGRLIVSSNPDIDPVYPIVIKPFYYSIKDQIQYGTGLNNKLTTLFPRASLVETITVPNNSGDIVKIEYVFRGHVDLLSADNRVAIMGEGIALDGTYSLTNS